jgi:hypothetical protein
LDALIQKYVSINDFVVTKINQPSSSSFIVSTNITLISPIDYDMYYTTDGSKPVLGRANTKKLDKHSLVKIPLTSTTTIKAAISTVLSLGVVNTETYTMKPSPTEIEVESFTVSCEMFVNVGNKGQISVSKILPTNATEKNISYKALNDFASVSSSGQITGKKFGWAKIEVKVGSVKRIINIKINKIKIKLPSAVIKHLQTTSIKAYSAR